MSLALLISMGFAVSVPAAAAASTPKDVVCSTLGSAGCSKTPSNGVDLNNTITAIVNILSVVVGLVAVIMIIFGGFMFVSSNGDSGKLTNARHTVIYAIVGLVVVAFSQAMVRFVLGRIVR